MLRLGQDMAERHRIVQLEVVPRKFGAFVFFMRRRRLFCFPKQGQTGLLTEGSLFSRRVISALPDRKQDAAAFKKGGACAEKRRPPPGNTLQAAGNPAKSGDFWERNSAKEAKRPTESPGGLASLLENRYYNGMRF